MKKFSFCFALIMLIVLGACKKQIGTPEVSQNSTLEDITVAFLNIDSRQADMIKLSDLERVKKAVSKAVDCMFNTSDFSVLSSTIMRSKSGDFMLSTLVKFQDGKQKNFLTRLRLHENRLFIPYMFTRDLAELPPAGDEPGDLCTYCEGNDCCYVEWNMNTNVMSCKCEGGAHTKCRMRQKKC